MATIYIDNKPYEVKDGQNLLHACLSLGFDIPYFCWHPAMHSVGACRQCAVKQFKDEKDTKGKIVMSCMTPVADGIRISIDDPEAKAFRAGVIEWLMLNHPHDCPVCDEGGECHLQDMTLMTGHVYRKTRFKKRTYRNQYLGPFVNHEMNRCIQCYRCVRFYRDYAGGGDLNVFSSHHHVYFGRNEDGVLENEFSGNLVEVCPTGVFTDKTLKRHYTRKWDLQTAPSICVHCGLGCNTIPGERYGKLRRILNRYNGDINGYFLCDRGRFGYEFVNSSGRIRQPLIRDNEGRLEPVPKEEALERISRFLYFGAKVIGIGSPRASLEANFALRRLVGPERFYSGMDEREHRLVSAIIGILRKGPARIPSLREVASADAVFILGEDVTNTAPMLALGLRQSVRQKPMEEVSKLGIPLWSDSSVREAIQDEKGPLFVAASCNTKLDDIAAETYYASPDDIARLGFAVAHELDEEAPGISGGLSLFTDEAKRSRRIGTVPAHEEIIPLARKIARSLKTAKKPLIVSGMSSGSKDILFAAANVAWALRNKGADAGLFFVTKECNSIGAGLMASGGSIDDAFKAVEKDKADAVIILENDLYRRTDASQVEKLFKRSRHVIVIDQLFNQTSSAAEITLPAGAFAESDGTVVNNEGRAQRFFQIFVPEGETQESWRWLKDIMTISRSPLSWQPLDDVTSDLAKEMPVFGPISEIAPHAGFRISGQRIPRQPHRYSGRTAISAGINVHEPRPPDDPDSPLSFSMEGYEGMPPSSLISRYWAPAWNSVQSLNKFQSEVGGPLKGGDPGRRLIEPEKKEVPYFDKPPGVFEPREDEFMVVPLYHIFGSEELSLLSPGIAELCPKPYFAINSEDAERLGIKEGSEGELEISGMTYRLPVVIKDSLPKGVAGLPVLPQLQGIALPEWGRLRKI